MNWKLCEKEAVEAQFEVLVLHFQGRIEQNHVNPPP
jgi:hypothetical protein